MSMDRYIYKYTTTQKDGRRSEKSAVRSFSFSHDQFSLLLVVMSTPHTSHPHVSFI